MEPSLSLIETSLDWCDEVEDEFSGGIPVAVGGPLPPNGVGSGCTGIGPGGCGGGSIISEEDEELGSGSGLGAGESMLMDSSSLYTPTSLFSNEEPSGSHNTEEYDNTNFSTDSLDRLQPLYEGKKIEYQLTMFDEQQVEQQQQQQQQQTGFGNKYITITEKDNKNNHNVVMATKQNKNNTTTTTTTLAATANATVAANVSPGMLNGQQQQQQHRVINQNLNQRPLYNTNTNTNTNTELRTPTSGGGGGGVIMRHKRGRESSNSSAGNSGTGYFYPYQPLPDLTFLQYNNTKLNIQAVAGTGPSPTSSSDISMASLASGASRGSSVASGRRNPTPVNGIPPTPSPASAASVTRRIHSAMAGHTNTTGSGSGSSSNRSSSSSASCSSRPRPLSLNDLERLKSNVVDWNSLYFLLPAEVKSMFGPVRPEENRAHKRFSLQEPILEEDIRELTTDLDKNLGLYEKLVTATGGGNGKTKMLQLGAGSGGGGNGTADSNCSGGRSGGDNTIGMSEYEAPINAIINGVNKVKSSRTTLKTVPHLNSIIYPNIYQLLATGLNPTVSTIFGPIANTVWKMVEESIHGNNNTGVLQELIMRINAEDGIDEGPIKINCFMNGLLNLHLLATYFSYLRSKEKLLRTHYDTNSFMYQSNTGTKLQYDCLLNVLNELQAKGRFDLDIFNEVKEMMKKISGVSMRSSKEKSSSSKRPSSSRPDYLGGGGYGRVTPAGGGGTGRTKSTRPSTTTATTPTGGGGGHYNYYNYNQYDKYGGSGGGYYGGSKMKRSFSDERPKRPAAGGGGGATVIPKSTTHYFNGLEKGMLETGENNSTLGFRKLKLQWEEKSSSQQQATLLLAPGSKIPVRLSSGSTKHTKV